MDEIKRIDGRGGRRPGSGRPRKPDSEKRPRVTVTAMVSADTRRRLTELKAHGVKLGRLLDSIIAGVAAEHGIE